MLKRHVLTFVWMLALALGTASAQQNATSTPNYNLGLPPIHSVNWGTVLNDNTSVIDGLLAGSTPLLQSFWGANPATATNWGAVKLFAGPSNTTAENASNKGVAGGYAPLDSNAKIPLNFLSSVLGSVTVTNSPSSSLDTLITDDTTHAHWGRMTPSMLAPDFAISGYGCSQSTFEVGQSFANPTCTVSYVGGSPSAATVSDGTSGGNHTVALSSPFTSVILPYTYTLASSGSVCFSLSVSPTPTSGPTNYCSSWLPRQWAGISSTSSATTTVTTSGNSAVLSTSETLSSAGLRSNPVGYTFGPFNSSGTFYIVLVVQGCGHTNPDSFTASNFNFPMTNVGTVTVTDQWGTPVSGYCMYRSTNALAANSGPWNIYSNN